jgi:hypothetical protein
VNPAASERLGVQGVAGVDQDRVGHAGAEVGRLQVANSPTRSSDQGVGAVGDLDRLVGQLQAGHLPAAWSPATGS